MEFTIFPRPDFTALLQRLVEAWLHTDLESKASEQYQRLKLELTNSAANPIYLIVDPRKPLTADAVLARYDGADLPNGSSFKAWLEDALRKHAR